MTTTDGPTQPRLRRPAAGRPPEATPREAIPAPDAAPELRRPARVGRPRRADSPTGVAPPRPARTPPIGGRRAPHPLLVRQADRRRRRWPRPLLRHRPDPVPDRVRRPDLRRGRRRTRLHRPARVRPRRRRQPLFGKRPRREPDRRGGARHRSSCSCLVAPVVLPRAGADPARAADRLVGVLLWRRRRRAADRGGDPARSSPRGADRPADRDRRGSAGSSACSSLAALGGGTVLAIARDRGRRRARGDRPSPAAPAG